MTPGIASRTKIAVTLVWVSITLSALGIVLRGLIPLHILLWLGGLGLAIWYTNKASLHSTLVQLEPTSVSLTSRPNSWLDGEGVGLTVVLIVTILFFLSSLAKWTNRGLGPEPTAESAANHEQRSAKPTMTPEELTKVQQADLYLLTLNKLVVRCGEPMTDKTRAFTEAKIKGIMRRDLSYKSEKGSVIMLTFWNGSSGGKSKNWEFLSMLDGGVEYRAEDSSHILSALPCMGE
jgi:hypothetical protein